MHTYIYIHTTKNYIKIHPSLFIGIFKQNIFTYKQNEEFFKVSKENL